MLYSGMTLRLCITTFAKSEEFVLFYFEKNHEFIHQHIDSVSKLNDYLEYQVELLSKSGLGIWEFAVINSILVWYLAITHSPNQQTKIS